MQILIDRLMTLGEWQIVGAVILTLWEGAIFTVFPEEVVMCVLGVLVFQGRIPFEMAWLAVTIGLLPANLFTVLIGRGFGMAILKRAPFRWFIDPGMVQAILEPVRQKGVWIVAATRFTPIIRGPVYFSVGTSQFKPLRFLRTDFLASLAQIPLWISLGQWMGARSESIAQSFQWIGFLFAGLLLGGAVFKLGWDYRKKRRFKSRR